MPSSRKDRALERRRREEAEGDRRIMGSGRRVGTFWLSAREGLVGMLEELDWDFFWMKGTASLRTWEKSWGGQSRLERYLIEEGKHIPWA